MPKPKLLWVADNIRPTGFQRVTSSLLRRLCDRYEVHSLAINYNGDPHEEPYACYPASIRGDVLGRNRIRELVLQIEPDVIVCLNDIWAIYDYWVQVKDLEVPFVAYFPVDAEGYTPQMVQFLEGCDRVITYTEFGRQVLKSAQCPKTVELLPHGVDTETFYPVNKLEARAAFGLDSESFIVFNGNRNQPRKRLDLTIKGFVKFAANHSKEKTKLHLHCGSKDIGWDVLALFKREAAAMGLINWQQYLSLTNASEKAQSIPAEALNLLYNTADVGINTSLAEGWGLCSTEQAACCIPQIVPNHSACAELFRERGWLIPITQTITDTGFNLEGGLVSEFDVWRSLETLYADSELRAEFAYKGYQYFSSAKFDWNAIAQSLHNILQEVLGQVVAA